MRVTEMVAAGITRAPIGVWDNARVTAGAVIPTKATRSARQCKLKARDTSQQEHAQVISTAHNQAHCGCCRCARQQCEPACTCKTTTCVLLPLRCCHSCWWALCLYCCCCCCCYILCWRCPCCICICCSCCCCPQDTQCSIQARWFTARFITLTLVVPALRHIHDCLTVAACGLVQRSSQLLVLVQLMLRTDHHSLRGGPASTRANTHTHTQLVVLRIGMSVCCRGAQCQAHPLPLQA
jgi:hypothetical protein